MTQLLMTMKHKRREDVAGGNNLILIMLSIVFKIMVSMINLMVSMIKTTERLYW